MRHATHYKIDKRCIIRQININYLIINGNQYYQGRHVVTFKVVNAKFGKRLVQLGTNFCELSGSVSEHSKNLVNSDHVNSENF